MCIKYTRFKCTHSLSHTLSLSLSLSPSLPQGFEGVHTCLPSESLYTIVERLATTKVRHNYLLHACSCTCTCSVIYVYIILLCFLNVCYTCMYMYMCSMYDKLLCFLYTCMYSALARPQTNSELGYVFFPLHTVQSNALHIFQTFV